MKIALVLLLLVAAALIWNYFPGKSLPDGTVVDRLIVMKSERKMIAFAGNRELKTYKIALGGAPLGHKQFEGDRKTPEGIYTINDRNPNSASHKNLGVSYPNANDSAIAEAQ